MTHSETSGEPGAAAPAPGCTAAPPREIPHDLYCQQCGYNLRGLISNRCPECGHSLETVRATEPQIPWVHRKKLGWFRAYWKTIGLVMFRQRRFCEEMARPVSYRDSQSFRWLTILHAYVPIVASTIALYVFWFPRADEGEVTTTAFATVWPVVGFHLLLLLYLAAMTGLPGYFFHPKDVPILLQNRAIALSYYACGPLALTALPSAATITAAIIGGEGDVVFGLTIFAVVFPVAQLIVWLLDLTHVCRRIMPQRKRRADLIAVCLPLSGLLLGLLIFVGIPAGVFYVFAMLATLG